FNQAADGAGGGDRDAVCNAQGKSGRTCCEELARDRPGANGVEACVAVAEIASGGEERAIEVKLIGGVEGDLDGRLRDGMEQAEIGVAAHPDARGTGFDIPGRMRLPAGVVERGRGPRRIIAGAPDALLRRDGDDGLRRELNWDEDESDNQ